VRTLVRIVITVIAPRRRVGGSLEGRCTGGRGGCIGAAGPASCLSGKLYSLLVWISNRLEHEPNACKSGPLRLFDFMDGQHLLEDLSRSCVAAPPATPPHPPRAVRGPLHQSDEAHLPNEEYSKAIQQPAADQGAHGTYAAALRVVSRADRAASPPAQSPPPRLPLPHQSPQSQSGSSRRRRWQRQPQRPPQHRPHCPHRASEARISLIWQVSRRPLRTSGGRVPPPRTVPH
jgi:hypothetical protein